MGEIIEEGVTKPEKPMEQDGFNTSQGPLNPKSRVIESFSPERLKCIPFIMKGDHNPLHFVSLKCSATTCSVLFPHLCNESLPFGQMLVSSILSSFIT
jgi:hypothetical protein